MHEEDDLVWWEVRYYTQHPFTNTAMVIADTQDEAWKKFKKREGNENKSICKITMIK